MFSVGWVGLNRFFFASVDLCLLSLLNGSFLYLVTFYVFWKPEELFEKKTPKKFHSSKEYDSKYTCVMYIFVNMFFLIFNH